MHRMLTHMPLSNKAIQIDVILSERLVSDENEHIPALVFYAY